MTDTEAICAADCTSGCHTSDCEHHGHPDPFYCVVCGAALLEERQFCADCEQEEIARLRTIEGAARAVATGCLYGEHAYCEPAIALRAALEAEG
jgi:hypothetical protein